MKQWKYYSSSNWTFETTTTAAILNRTELLFYGPDYI